MPLLDVWIGTHNCAIDAAAMQTGRISVNTASQNGSAKMSRVEAPAKKVFCLAALTILSIFQIILIFARMFRQLYKCLLRMYIRIAIDKHSFKIYPVYILLSVHNPVESNALTKV